MKIEFVYFYGLNKMEAAIDFTFIYDLVKDMYSE